MKTRSASALGLLAALCTLALAPLSATSRGEPAACYSVDRIPISGAPRVVRGTPASEVESYLGVPRAKLADGTWVYYDFTPSQQLLKDKGCTTVLIVFHEGRVFQIAAANATALPGIAVRVAARKAAKESLATSK